MGAAHASSSERTECLGCGDKLCRMDLGRQYCLLCRSAKAKGPAAWARRMRLVNKYSKKRRIPDDPFKGFREGDK